MKKNIGAQLALYPAPVIVVGAIVNDKPTWTLVAHAGTMAYSHLMVSLVHAHYINCLLYTSYILDNVFCISKDMREILNRHVFGSSYQVLCISLMIIV